MTASLWIIATGILAAAACGLLGSFLVLRKTSMLGDAISHAVLPGIALAFLISGSRNPIPMLIGAGALGLITAFCTETLHRVGRLQQDASIGVTFTWLFALGVILISMYAGQVDLDQECVLYGEIAYVPWDVWLWNGLDMGPRAIWVLGATFLIDLVFVLTCYKELKLTTFDPQLAESLGISTRLFHYLLMAAVSLTTVAAFESVGAILVVAMLIAPAAAAYLLTDRLSRMLVLAMIIGAASAVTGYLLASWLDASIAGAMATMSGIFFALSFFLAPRHGLLPKHFARLSTK
ncbi:MAG: iron ABC transporter [Deltaproteobacteria bacterium CG11_big_fil_rev_8_21_14_0_20_47_16]|nr:MAG: iron ABC transporter [Deltaproteobacteria bacterium CG11_big_fil_rev_8_21_14_0_20_47_16]